MGEKKDEKKSRHDNDIIDFFIQINELVIHEVFETKAEETPEAIALVMDEETLTYSQLNRKANQLAHFLRDTQHDKYLNPVVLLFDRSNNYIIALLATLKAGFLALPLDKNLNQNTIETILETSAASLILSDSSGTEDISQFSNLTAIDIELVSDERIHNPQCNNDENDIALMLYSSGTTGPHKGSTLGHYGISLMVKEQIKGFEINQDDVILLNTSIFYDSSIAEIFTALFSGATLVINTLAPEHKTPDFIQFIRYHQISLLTLSPGALASYNVEDLSSLRVMIVAGAILYKRQVWRFCKQIHCFNGYGLSEASVCSTYEYINPYQQYDNIIPIGRPISEAVISIRDAKLNEVPLGEKGEICISGPGLSHGYHDQPELTELKFIPHPDNTGEKLLRTGDLGKSIILPAPGGGEIQKIICYGRGPQRAQSTTADDSTFINDRQEKLFEYLHERGFRPTVDDDKDIKIIFKGHYYYVRCLDSAAGYYQIFRPFIIKIDSEKEKINGLQVANEISRGKKLVSITLEEDDEFYVNFEFLHDDVHAFMDNFTWAINSMFRSVNSFKTKMSELNNTQIPAEKEGDPEENPEEPQDSSNRNKKSLKAKFSRWFQ